MSEKRLLKSPAIISDVIDQLYSEWTEQTEIGMVETLETAYQLGRERLQGELLAALIEAKQFLIAHYLTSKGRELVDKLERAIANATKNLPLVKKGE